MAAGHAQDKCLHPAEDGAMDAPAVRDVQIAHDLARLADCQKNAAFLARLGHLLNQAERYGEALDHLERALLLAPALIDAQLDYAVALAGSGDAPSALALLDAMQSRPDLPESLAPVLTRVRQRWQDDLDRFQQADNGSRRRVSLDLRLGRDSNLLGVPNLGSLALTLPGETLVLPLDPSNTAHAGAYLRSDLRMDLAQTQASGLHWDFSAALLQRNSPSALDVNTRQGEIQFEIGQYPRGDQLGHYLNLNLAHLQTHGGTRYRSAGAGLGLDHPSAAGCNRRFGLDLQDRRLDSNTLLSGRYAGLSLTLGCVSHGTALSTSSLSHWHVVARWGSDHPVVATRPGGRQQQAGLRLVAGFNGTPMRNGLGPSRWQLDAELSHSRDASGYSALLDNGRIRHTTRLALRAELQQPLAPGLLITLGTERAHQRASLPLFRLHSWSPYAALRWEW